MKNKIIDILSENIEQLDKEEIAAALEIPKKTDMGDFAFPCFKLARVFRKAPNMIAEELTAQINEKGYDIFDKVVNVGAYINFFLAKEAFAKEIPDTTKLIIAQRVSSIQSADRIIVMDNGEISGFDTHENLMKSNEIYRDVYESQTKGGGDFDENGGE